MNDFGFKCLSEVSSMVDDGVFQDFGNSGFASNLGDGVDGGCACAIGELTECRTAQGACEMRECARESVLERVCAPRPRTPISWPYRVRMKLCPGRWLNPQSSVGTSQGWGTK